MSAAGAAGQAFAATAVASSDAVPVATVILDDWSLSAASPEALRATIAAKLEGARAKLAAAEAEVDHWAAAAEKLR